MSDRKVTRPTMKKLSFAPALVCFAVLLTAASAAKPGTHHAAAPQAFRIQGAVEKPAQWTAESLSKAFAGDVKTISYTLKGEKGQAQCVPLLAMVQAAKPRLNAKIKNHQLAFVLIVRAEDGYTVAFSLGELLPAYGKREVWLALDHDGKPLTEKEGPVALLVPEDEKPSRWVHRVTGITVMDGTQTAGQKHK